MHCCISFSRDEFETTRCEAPRQCLHIPDDSRTEDHAEQPLLRPTPPS
ncbi:hypothetical protein V6Z11_D06G123500 [Gossypium hirsutum]